MAAVRVNARLLRRRLHGDTARSAVAPIAALAALLMLPSFLWGPFAIDSGALNLVWTQQVAEALGRGEVYPRWLSASFEGLGSPTFYFYPPLAFALSGALDLAGFSTFRAINVAALVALLGSGLAMYAWLRFKGAPALLGACLYMAAPYHLTDFYVRAALAEFAAFVWLPLIALGIEAQPRRWAGPLLAVSFAGLILTHLPMAVLTVVALIVPMIVHRVTTERNAGLLVPFGLAGVVGLLLSAVYLLPALTLQEHISVEALWSPFYQPENRSLFSRTPGVPVAALTWPVPIAACAVVLALGAAAAARSRGERQPAFWAGLVTVTAVLALALVPGFWSLPLLAKVQFPWRMLAIVEFAAVTALALSGGLTPLALKLGRALVILAYARIVVLVAYTHLNVAFPEDLARTMPDAPEYLPAGFDVSDLDQRHRLPDLSEWHGPLVRGPASEISVDADGTVHLEATGTGLVVVRRFSFPSWQVERDGRAVETAPQGPGRLIGFQAEPGRYVLARRTLPEERTGAWLSLLGLALVVPLWRRWPRRSPVPATGTALAASR